MILWAALLTTWHSANSSRDFDKLDAIYSDYSDAADYANNRLMEMMPLIPGSYIDEWTAEGYGEIHALCYRDEGGNEYRCKYVLTPIGLRHCADSHSKQAPS